MLSSLIPSHVAASHGMGQMLALEHVKAREHTKQDLVVVRLLPHTSFWLYFKQK